MSASSRLQFYRLLFLLFCIPFLFCFSSADPKITYTCYKHGSNPYIVVFVEIADVVDIFGKGAQPSCGLKNMTGKGEKDVPYRLVVNLTGIGDVNPGPCGVVKTGNLVNLTIVTRTTNATVAMPTDREATISCDFSKDHIANSIMNVNLVKQKAVEENIHITLQFEGSPSELSVGTETRLEMKLTTLTRFMTISAFQCWAMRNSTDANKVLLLDNYCPVSAAPIALTFSNYKSYSTLRSNSFKVFRFSDSSVLFIRCSVDICLDSDGCTRCSSIKKRSLGKGEVPHSATVSASVMITENNDSKVFSGTQLPFLGTIVTLSVVIVILIGTIIALALKSYTRKILRGKMGDSADSEN